MSFLYAHTQSCSSADTVAGKPYSQHRPLKLFLHQRGLPSPPPLSAHTPPPTLHFSNATENYFYFNLKFSYSLPSLPVQRLPGGWGSRLLVHFQPGHFHVLLECTLKPVSFSFSIISDNFPPPSLFFWQAAFMEGQSKTSGSDKIHLLCCAYVCNRWKQ